MPKSDVGLFLAEMRTGYLSKKDDEVVAIQKCYSMYINATKMIATIYAYIKEPGLVEITIDQSKSFLREIDFSKLKTIERSHKEIDFSKWLFNHAVQYAEAERKPALEAAKEYDYILIEATREEIMEATNNGRKVSREVPK